MSPIALAEVVDRLVEAKDAFITESETSATISALSAVHASEILALCGPLGWPVKLFDAADEIWASAEIPDADFAPYRLVIQKPDAPADTLQLLSNHAFAHWLENGHDATRWHVARVSGSLIVGSRVIQSWDGALEPAMLEKTKSPRALVREFGNVRRVPEDVRLWLAPALGADQYSQPAIQVWVRSASATLVSCLPDEIDAADGALKFRGPPRLTLRRFDATSDALDRPTFNTLLAVIHWIFENEREAEMRHILLAAELARAGTSSGSASSFLHEHLAHAWESAQIAYQMALAETGRDTLKVLTDLRKAVTEETAKLSDISRQLTSSVAAALAAGIGLIAARIAAKVPAELVVIVLLVVALYIAMVITSGVQFMRLQRQLRTDWQHRLYRFLPEAEYRRMVESPTTKAERSFLWTVWLGGAAVTALSLAGVWVVFAKFATPAPATVPVQPPAQIAPSSSPSTTNRSSAPANAPSSAIAPTPSKIDANASPAQPTR